MAQPKKTRTLDSGTSSRHAHKKTVAVPVAVAVSLVLALAFLNLAVLCLANKFENAIATFTKRPARFDDVMGTFEKSLVNIRKKPQPDSENASAAFGKRR